eukprot:UN02619
MKEKPQQQREQKQSWKPSEVGDFNTVLGFWRYYSWMKKPSLLDPGMNVYFFRDKLLPAWETFPKGGCWFIRFDRRHLRDGTMDQVWEELLP